MAIFPNYSVGQTEIQVRFRESFLSDVIDKKFLGIPYGVYMGFIPSFSGSVLKLARDASYGVSFLRVLSKIDTVAVDMVLEEDAQIDFADYYATAGTFPVYVVAEIVAKLGTPTVASILTQAAAPVNNKQVLICVVTAAGVINAIAPANRSEPYAFVGTPLGYGFMRSGAVEQALSVIRMLAEVQSARTDMTNFTHPSLKARLDADALPANMGNRIARFIRAFQTIVYTPAVTTPTLNISTSFSGLIRTAALLKPFVDVAGFGTEANTGAVTSGTVPIGAPSEARSDNVRNNCVVALDTGPRLTSDDGAAVYGKLSCSQVVLTATITFVITATVIPTTSTTNIAIGDIISDGSVFYGVTAIVPGVSFTINTPALSSIVTTTAVRRRFTVAFFTGGGAATDPSFSVIGGTPVRIYFPVWQQLDISTFDTQELLYEGGEPTPTTLATTALAGRVRMATGVTDGKAGALWRAMRGVDVIGSGNYHTINWTSANTVSAGVLNVTQRGATGPKGTDAGAGGPSGPQGLPGPQGPGFYQAVNFIKSAAFDHTLMPANTPYSFFMLNVPFDVLFVSGGLAAWSYPYFGNLFGSDIFTITNIRRTVDGLGRFRNVMIDMVTPAGAGRGVFKYYLTYGGKP